MSSGSAASKAPQGVEIPISSSLDYNRDVFASAMQAVDKAAADKIRGEKKWRSRYGGYLMEQVAVSVKKPENAVKIAQAGLNYLHSSMVFIRDSTTLPLNKAMESYTLGSYETVVIRGSKAKPAPYEIEVPYKDRLLRGEELKVQIDKWVRSGVIEMSTGYAMSKVVDTPNWLNLSDAYFVLLGAGSAMGPLTTLLALGANVIAVDIPRAGMWEKMIGVARQSSGTFTFPSKKSQTSSQTDAELAANAGCNLLTETPEVRNWLMTVEQGKPLTVGAYAYLDGALFLRVSVAMDAIVQDLVEKRKNVGVAYLCTPSDIHIIPAAAREHANNNLRKAPVWHALLRLLCRGKALKKNARKPLQDESGREYSVVDGVVVAQGPNYILAKRLQHWRAMVSRQAGCMVSTNIAPSTATVSVVHNKMFALAYQGMSNFAPMEVFQQDTSSAVMATLLIHDVRNVRSAAYNTTALPNPLNLFTETSFHGGVWRCAYKFDSIGLPSALLGLLSSYVIPGYLALYNGLQFAGWGTALLKGIVHALGRIFGGDRSDSLWSDCGCFISKFQFLAIMELAHALLGLVNSPVQTQLFQLLGRILLVDVLNYCTSAQSNSNPYVWLLVFAWSIAEVIRYSYYGLGIIKIDIPWLTWLRYTMFVVLYPCGVAGEMGCIHRGRDEILALQAKNPSLLVRLLRPALNLPYGYWITVVPMYCVVLPQLCHYMILQRKKILLKGGSKKSSKKNPMKLRSW